MIRQRIAAVLVLLLHTTRNDFFAGFFLESCFIERQLINPLAEEEQLAWIEGFILRSVETLEQCGGRRFDGGLHGRLNGLLKFSSMRLLTLGNDLLQQRRIIGQLLGIY